MYPNVRAEMARKKLNQEDVATAWDKTIGTVSLKLQGKFEITLREARILKDLLQTNLSIEELFETEEEA